MAENEELMSVPSRSDAPDGTFDGNAFEGNVVQFSLTLQGFSQPLVAHCKPNKITAEDLDEYNLAIEEAQFNRTRRAHLMRKIATVDNVDSAEYTELNDEIKQLAAERDDISINTDSILRPGDVTIKWNYWKDGEVIPLTAEDVKKKASLSIVNALALDIIQFVNSQQGKGSKKQETHSFSGSRARGRRAR